MSEIREAVIAHLIRRRAPVTASYARQAPDREVLEYALAHWAELGIQVVAQ